MPDSNLSMPVNVSLEMFMIKRYVQAVILLAIFLVIGISTGFAYDQELCQYAKYASATSSNAGSEPVYATGAPDADMECATWSGYGKSWNPSNWDVKANITLQYETPVKVTNFTVFGDYDMCWSRMWLVNSATGSTRQVFNGGETTCADFRESDGTFLADAIILETCGWSWSSTDSVSLCGIQSIEKTSYEDTFSDSTHISSSNGVFVSGGDIVLNSTASVEILRPNAVGDVTGINNQYPSSGYHWDKVDDTGTGDKDSTFIRQTTKGTNKYDIFNIPNRAGSGSISSVKISMRARKESSSGYGYVRNVIKTNSVVSSGTEASATTSYAIYSTSYSLNPATNQSWTLSDIDSLQIGAGARLPSTRASSVRVTQVWAEVSYLQDSGNVTSEPISPYDYTNSSRNELASWDRLCINDTVPLGTQIRYSILDASSNLAIPGFENISGGCNDISGLPVEHSSIKIFAKLSTNNPSLKPSIHSWNVSWSLLPINMAPEITINSPSEGTYYSQARTLNFSVIDDTGLVLDCWKDVGNGWVFAGQIANSSGYQSYENAKEGSNTWKIMCSDGIKNTTSQVSFVFLKTSSGVCQYAYQAEATDHAEGFEAIYAIGNSDSDVNCSTVPVSGKSWQKSSWDVWANITFTFPDPIYPENFTIFGDYDLCMNRVWLWRENSWYLAWEGGIQKSDFSDCSIVYNFTSSNQDFRTDRIKIETCGWTWSAIDAARFCGSTDTYPEISIISPVHDSIVGAGTAAGIAITTDSPAQCEFSYDRDFIFGQGTGMQTDGFNHIYDIHKPNSMDSVEIYYKCSSVSGKVNPFSVAHRFIFANQDNPFIQICNWQNCSKGAASVSIDDDPAIAKTVPTCMDKLDSLGIKGTYFLAFTDRYNQTDWDVWRSAYSNGHEIGGHSVSHTCSVYQTRDFFTSDLQANKNHILSGVGMPSNDLITYAWPCGVTSYDLREWLSGYYLFSRGYNKNVIESKNPENFLNYNSINTIGIGITPPDYYSSADAAENYGNWIIYVQHGACNNPEIFDYLLTKDLWVDTIGSVSKYIKERSFAQIKNIQYGTGAVSFDVETTLDAGIFDEPLTLKAYLGNGNMESVRINGQEAQFIVFNEGGQRYAKFDILPSRMAHIEITGLSLSVPYCGNGRIDQGSEQCDDGNIIAGDGCDSGCKKEINGTIFVILYIGNIDGSSAPTWYPFYDRLTSYYENNSLPVAFSFFPATIRSDTEFGEIFGRMYLAENIELMQKGYNMNKTEEQMDSLTVEQQRKIVEDGQNYYEQRMREILNITTVDMPVTWVAPFGRFTTGIRRVIEEHGFKTSFGLYYPAEIGPVSSSATVDCLQYGVSFTTSGAAGRDTVFKQPVQIIEEVLHYDRTDVTVLSAYGKRVVPLFAHQPDFEDSVVNGKIDENKWQIYKETIAMLSSNPNVILVTPSQVWKLRHPLCIPTGIPETFCNGADDDCDGIIDSAGCL